MKMSECIHGKESPGVATIKNSWLCMYKIPVAALSDFGGKTEVYMKMTIVKSACTPDNCRCFEAN